MSKVVILSGPVRSGKTTALTNWSASRSVGGVLSPDRNIGRVFLDLISGREEPMEAVTPADTDLLVGKFRFRSEAFAFAVACLEQACQEGKKHIIVDEVGPLELQGKGLNQGVRSLLEKTHQAQIILVVREGLVDRVISNYGIGDYLEITKDQMSEP